MEAVKVGSEKLGGGDFGPSCRFTFPNSRDVELRDMVNPRR